MTKKVKCGFGANGSTCFVGHVGQLSDNDGVFRPVDALDGI